MEDPRFSQLVTSLSHQAPSEAQVEKIAALRVNAISFASALFDYTKPSREQSLAITKLEESLMWAIKSIVLEGKR